MSFAGEGYELARDLGKGGYVFDAWPDLKTSLVPASGDPNKVGVPNSGPLGQVKVREAIEYAIDKQKICASVFNGYYQAVYDYAPPELRPAEPTGFVPRTYDPDQAKELLKEAGYPNGFSTTLYCDNQLNGDYIPMIQSYLNAVGIQTNVQIITIAKWIDMETNGWQDGLLISPTGNDPSLSNYFSRFWWTPDAPNWSHGIYWTALYRPPDLQTMLVNLMATPDNDQQITIGKQAVTYIAENCLAIPLWDWVSNEVMQPYVHDAFYQSQQLHRWDWVDAWMEQGKIKN
jgi:ABC-type transport system substrate-binding protein